MVEVTDNHAHANPLRGLGFLEVGRRFREEGGIAIVFAPLPSWHYSITISSPEGFKRVYEVVLRGVEEALDYLKALAVLGVHPAEIVSLTEVFGAEKAQEIAKKAMDMAGEYVSNGLAIGLGEVGRPHYKAPEVAVRVCNEVLEYSLELAKDLSCPVHLHLERGDEGLKDVMKKVQSVGINPSLVVIHHAEPKIIGRCGGLTPSIPRRGRNLEKAFMRKKLNFVVESDFIDDPKRPGVVAYPWTIALDIAWMIRQGLASEDGVYKVFIENFEKLYHVRIH
ncbi:MAG: TatD family hydrolase [Candidatus Nezhaarchaeota archaeon]|nr:TatD family hydrolase [Candidatus Nezhaarchaeota archaeon]MCX8142363.1 TatD family hydrolase [Candidatus Nezhaarchaeota archaeon]MDW8050664.1 TatD family hydrolase [Nitrososphaerota archaeon]